jgi:hypothetical protein
MSRLRNLACDRRERNWQGLNKCPNLIANTPVVRERFLVRMRLLGEAWRIGKPDMKDSCLAKEQRTCLMCIVTHGHDIIELHVLQLVNTL